MYNSLVDKNLAVIFKLKDTTFSNGKDTKICQGLRMIVNVDGNPPPAGFSANITIFGMNEKDMQLISSVRNIVKRLLTVQIYASDSRNAPLAIFSGIISDGRITYNNMPNVALEVVAFSALSKKGLQYPPVSYKKDTKAQDILAGIAKFAGYDFENQNVDETITNCYLTDSVATNIDAICRDKNIQYSIENNKLIIWKNERKGTIPLINVKNGLVGYPTAGITGIYFNCLYNPNILIGAHVEIESSYEQCSGQFQVLSMTHNLSYELPNGPWFTMVQAQLIPEKALSSGVK